MSLTKETEKTKYNQLQIGNSSGKDSTVVDQSESGDSQGSSSRVVESNRSQNGKSVQTSSSRERYAIGVRVSFTVPIRSTTPVDIDKC